MCVCHTDLRGKVQLARLCVYMCYTDLKGKVQSARLCVGVHVLH